MIQHPNQQPARTAMVDETNNDTVPVRGCPDMDSGLFSWVIRAKVQKGGPLHAPWAITLYITAEGGIEPEVFVSNTVYAASGSTTQVPFPATPQGKIAKNSYGVGSISTQYAEGGNTLSQVIGVRLVEIPGGVSVSIVDTKITPTWIIGARDISLIDDPVYDPDQELSVSSEEESVASH